MEGERGSHEMSALTLSDEFANVRLVVNPHDCHNWFLVLLRPTDLLPAHWAREVRVLPVVRAAPTMEAIRA